MRSPGVELPRAREISPDLAGWRVERLPKLPTGKEPITVAPDWVCEILSPSTASYDNIVKRRFYLDVGVRHLWYIDPARKSLEACRESEGKWLQLGVFGGDEKVRAEPFEAVELELAEWWDESENEGDE